MKEFITPMVLAATIGMYTNVRPVEKVVLMTIDEIKTCNPNILQLVAGTDDIEETVLKLDALLEGSDLSIPVESNINAKATRFHELVDKEFLEILTTDERHELEVLTQWQHNQKSAFYKHVATKELQD